MDALVEGEDVPALMRLVDALAGQRDWDGLVTLARRCREAVERGHQMWPVAMYVDYRLALEAPGPYAAAVLESTASRFTAGPLTEVAASTHTWADLVEHLPGRHVAAVVAQERVMRGEDLTDDDRAALDLSEMPGVLAPGEDAVAPWLPVFRHDGARTEDPEAPPDAQTLTATAGAESPGDPAVVADIRRLYEGWSADDGPVVRIAWTTEDEPSAAIGLLATDVRLAEISAGEALARMTWAGSGGGSTGRRRGGATGRFDAWWTAAAIAGVEWPLDLGELTAVEWCWWEPVPRPHGWVSALAATTPGGGCVAWLAVDAVDTEDTVDAGHDG